MTTTLLFLLLGVAAIAAIGTLVALLRQRAPRVPVDPELVARARDLHAERLSRRLAAEVEERIAHQLDAPGNGLAPQLQQPLLDARVWAGAR